MNNSDRFRLSALGIALGASLVGAAQAAPINLTPKNPDLTTFSASFTYTYVAVCERPSNGAISTCGGQFTTPRWDLSYGYVRVTKNGTQVLNPGDGLIGVTDPNGAANNYDLTVVLGFNSGGTGLSGILASDPWTGDTLRTSSLSAIGSTSNPNFQSGTIVTGTPTDATAYGYAFPFGYASATPNTSGIFEFVFDNVGGDFGALGYDSGRIIISVSGLTSPGTGSWDSQGVGFWKTSHSGSANVNTFVPVPAAVWLFGSGLVSLFGARLARKHKDV